MKARLVLRSLSALPVEELTGGAASQLLRDRLGKPSQIGEPTRADLEALQEHSARFREDLLRRHYAPYPDSWFHGGLNE
jgi:hypothetical protein